MGFEPPITIEKIIVGIEGQKYVLPAIQREFVWDTEQIENLFDSLMRGYPIGSFLFWRLHPDNLSDYQFFRFMDFYHQRDAFHNLPLDLKAGQEHIAVLDGQQRITALNIGLRGYYAEKLPYYRWNSDYAFPKQHLYLNIFNPSEENEQGYSFRMKVENSIKKQDVTNYCFRVGDILRFKQIEEVFDHCVQNGLTQDGATHYHRMLMRLWRLIKEQPIINYFAEEEQNLEKVLNIFIRVNSGGTVLSYSDMLLSIATAQWKEKDARNEIHNLVDELNRLEDGFAFDKDFVLKAALVLTDIPTIEFRTTSFTRSTMLHIEKCWERLRDCLLLTVKLLSDWGYNYQTLTSANATIPLAYHIYKLGCPKDFCSSKKYESDRQFMQKWFSIALLKRTFGGHSDSVLRQVRTIQKEEESKSFPLETIKIKLRPTSKSMDFGKEEMAALLDYKYGQAYTFTILSMLYPWLKYDQVFHIDHIFPKSLFTKKRLTQIGIPEDRWGEWLDHVNDLANLQLLQEHKNISKKDEDFEKWLKGQCPQPQDLAHYKNMHMIPDVELSFMNFPEFLKAREEILLQNLQSMLS